MYRYRTQYLAATAAETAAALAGPTKGMDGRWRIPPDCYDLVGLHPPDVELADESVLELLPERVARLIRPQQAMDIRFLLGGGGGIIAHPTSGGKTLIGLATAECCATGPESTALFLGPAIARGVWAEQARTWLGRELIQLRGKTPRELAAGHWYYLNYEVLGAWGGMLATRMWDYVCLDECHEMRGRRTQRGLGLKRALDLGTPVVVGLSATPIWARLTDLWQLLDYVRPGWFGTYRRFALRYADAHDGLYGLEMGRASHADELRHRLRYTVRRLSKAELLPDLIPLRRTTLAISNPTAAKRLAAGCRAVVDDLGDDPDPRALREALATVLRRETSTKVATLADLLRRLPNARRVLVLTQLRISVSEAATELRRLGHVVFEFHGEQELDERLERLQAGLQSPATAEQRVFVCCTGASIKQSINAVGYDTMLLLDYPWTAEELLQYEGRIHRKGLTTEAHVAYAVIEDSFDEDVLRLLCDRLEDRGAVLGNDANEKDLLDTLDLTSRATLDALLARVGLD